MNNITVINIDELKEILNSTIENKLSAILSQKEPKIETELVTRSEVAKKLHISLPTLGNLTKAGDIKSYRVGRRVLYNWHEVKNDLDQRNYTKYQRKDLK